MYPSDASIVASGYATPYPLRIPSTLTPNCPQGIGLWGTYRPIPQTLTPVAPYTRCDCGVGLDFVEMGWDCWFEMLRVYITWP